MRVSYCFALTNGNVVVIVDANQIPELQVSCQRRGLAGNAFHGTPISKEAESVVVDQLESWLVEHASGVCLGNSKTNSIGEALSERSSRHFDAGRIVRLRVAGSYAVDLAEVLEVVHAEFVAEEVEESILQHASVAIGQDETVPIEPRRVLRVEGHELVEEDVGHRGHAHGRTRVARVCLEGGIDLELSYCQPLILSLLC